MALIFQAIFTWATPLMDGIKAGKSLLAGLVRDGLGTGPLGSLLADGVIEGVGSVLVFLPQILILFGFIAILEDCGYMARVAYLMDKLMARCGLSGKSFLPMLSSVACAVPGILATRTIEQRRDRLATILVAPLMSCSARLPVYTLMISAFFPICSDANPGGYPWWTPGLILFCMYALGVILAPMVAYVLKRTLLKGATPPFVMEMPLYRWPSWKNVIQRMTESAGEFIKRAGTIIVASMIVVWALLYFPRGGDAKGTYDEQVAALNEKIDELKKQDDQEQQIEQLEGERDKLLGKWKRESWLGSMGRAIEPVVEPLGWDWKIGMAALASFPAREVIVGTLGMIYNLGDAEPDELKDKLAEKMREEEREGQPGRKVFTVPVALSIMVFFALCCQCASTLAVIKRETKSWGWPVFTFVYMTTLAYVGAMLTYQIGTWMSA
jgi:ferrous iron transport protein B